MGKQTQNFRQSTKSRSGNSGAQQYNQMNRGAWHMRVINYFKNKGGNKLSS